MVKIWNIGLSGNNFLVFELKKCVKFWFEGPNFPIVKTWKKSQFFVKILVFKFKIGQNFCFMVKSLIIGFSGNNFLVFELKKCVNFWFEGPNFPIVKTWKKSQFFVKILVFKFKIGQNFCFMVKSLIIGFSGNNFFVFK